MLSATGRTKYRGAFRAPSFDAELAQAGTKLMKVGTRPPIRESPQLDQVTTDNRRPLITLFRFTQIDYYLRCTFPVWHHWTAKYTRKGLMLQRRKTVLRRSVLVAIISSLCWLKLHPRDTQRLVELFSGARTTIVSAIREGLLRARRMLS